MTEERQKTRDTFNQSLFYRGIGTLAGLNAQPERVSG